MTDWKELPIGQRIRHERLGFPMTQADLAWVAGMDRARLSRIETGKVGLSVGDAMALAHALGLTIEDLLEDTEPRRPQVHICPPEE